MKGFVCVKLKIDRKAMRRAHLAVAVGFVVMLVGVILFQDEGEDAIQAVGLVGLVVTFGIYIFLDERAGKRRERGQ